MPSRATIRDRVKYLPPTRISGVGETSGFDPATMPNQLIWSPRWPLLASAPATVVNGQRFRLAEAGREFGREHLGVGWVWVPQDSVTMGVWQSDGSDWWPLSPIPDRPVLPADDSTFGTVVIVGGELFRWNGYIWIMSDSTLYVNGETLVVNGETLVSPLALQGV